VQNTSLTTRQFVSKGHAIIVQLFDAKILFSLLASAAIAANGAGLDDKALTCIEPDAKTGSSLAVIVDDVPLVHTMQVLASTPKEDAAKQAEDVIAQLDTILKSAGTSLSRACKLNIYLASDEALPSVQKALAGRFAGSTKPAVAIVSGRLAHADALVAMDAVAAADAKGDSDQKPRSENGIRSFAVLPNGPKIYVSGMADTNAMPEATQKTLEKLTAAIGHLGLGKKDIVQLKAFLEPMENVELVRKEIVAFFEGDAPPVAFVEWVSPKPNPPIEIELVAPVKGDFSKETNSVTFLTPPGTTDSKVFRRVARVNRGKVIYVSGLYGEISGDGGVQVREIFRSLKGILQQTGSDFEHLAKATYYVSDDEASNKLNEIRPQFYKPDRPPAASKAKVKGVGMSGKTVTMDMIAVTK
jgi:enamine deaminase RidA (YjgF/YER057c/UK114 family)